MKFKHSINDFFKIHKGYFILLITFCCFSCTKEDDTSCKLFNQKIVWSASSVASHLPDWTVRTGDEICLAYRGFMEWRDIKTGVVVHHLRHDLINSELIKVGQYFLIKSGNTLFPFDPAKYIINSPININFHDISIVDNDLYYIYNGEIFKFDLNTMSSNLIMAVGFGNFSFDSFHCWKEKDQVFTLISTSTYNPEKFKHTKLNLSTKVETNSIILDKDLFNGRTEFVEGFIKQKKNGQLCLIDPIFGSTRCVDGEIELSPLPGKDQKNVFVMATKSSVIEYDRSTLKVVKDTKIDVSRFYTFDDPFAYYFNRMYYSGDNYYVLDNFLNHNEFIKISGPRCQSEIIGRVVAIIGTDENNLIYFENNNLKCTTSNIL
jgi:hypothetical protein